MGATQREVTCAVSVHCVASVFYTPSLGALRESIPAFSRLSKVPGSKPGTLIPSSQQQFFLSRAHWPPLLPASLLHQNLTAIPECGLLRWLASLRSAGLSTTLSSAP